MYRDFPIIQIHPEATLAAMAAQCANDQGQSWQIHDRIFREQDTRGTGLIRFAASDLKQWAKDVRLDAATFDACLDSEKHLLKVGRDYTDGLKAGVTGTPTFVINGHVIAGPQPYATFRSLIEKLLAP